MKMIISSKLTVMSQQMKMMKIKVIYTYVFLMGHKIVLTLLYHTKIAQSAMLYWSFIKKGMKTAIGSYTTRKKGQNYS